MKHIRLITAFLLSGILSTGCVDEEYDKYGVPGAEEMDLVITIHTPPTITTRALIEADETRIATLDVIVFRDNGTTSPETYLYKTHATDFTVNGNETTVKIGLKKSTAGEKHRLVFVANQATEVAAVESNWATTDTKNEVLETIIFDAYAATETDETKRVWDTTTPRYLPMWGEADATHVITNSLLGSSIGTIRMLRAVTTADIRLNPDAANNNTPQSFPHFRLKDVKLYNVPQKGYTVPNPDYVTKTANTLQVTKPTYSDTFTRRIIHYVVDTSLGQDENGMGGVIYIPEAPNLTPAGVNIDDSEQTCLVISGYYGAGNTTTETWYRIDFINSLSPTENIRYDILRNHFCSFLITSVNGPGYETEEEAFNSAPVNIESTVLVWDQYNMSDIIFDGTYYLAVTKGEYILSREAQGAPDEDNKLTVETNAEGWTAAVWGNSEGTTAVPNDPVTGSPWLSITPLQAPAIQTTREASSASTCPATAAPPRAPPTSSSPPPPNSNMWYGSPN